jgi:hypothetical protein
MTVHYPPLAGEALRLKRNFSWGGLECVKLSPPPFRFLFIVVNPAPASGGQYNFLQYEQLKRRTLLFIRCNTNSGVIAFPRWRGKYFDLKHFPSGGGFNSRNLSPPPFNYFSGLYIRPPPAGDNE